MDERVREALARDRIIDITTTGRFSGEPRRIEIRFRDLDGAIYITGSPGKRGWYANLRANPAFTFHLKQSVTADLPAHARPITDAEERRRIMTQLATGRGRTDDLEARIAGSPLVAVTFEES